MMTRVFLWFVFLPSFAFAQDINNYIPPPMFSGEALQSDSPPLPPRRPRKLNPPNSYIEYIRKNGHAPKLIKPVSQEHISEDSLIKPDAQAILKQINPQ